MSTKKRTVLGVPYHLLNKVIAQTHRHLLKKDFLPVGHVQTAQTLDGTEDLFWDGEVQFHLSYKKDINKYPSTIPVIICGVFLIFTFKQDCKFKRIEFALQWGEGGDFYDGTSNYRGLTRRRTPKSETKQIRHHIGAAWAKPAAKINRDIKHMLKYVYC